MNPARDQADNEFVDAFLDLSPAGTGKSLEEWEFAARATVSFFGAHCKHLAFEEERESRVVMNGRNDSPQHRVQGSLIVPYIELEIGPDFPMLVKEVIVGPIPHKELTGRAIKNMLQRHEWGSVAVYCSEMPYRG